MFMDGDEETFNTSVGCGKTLLETQIDKYGCGYFNTTTHITYSICTQLLHDEITIDVLIFFLNLKLVALTF
jgi:hypothetical protein